MSGHDNSRRRKYNSIPDRWLRCPRKSVKLLDEKFVIFKTPLSHAYDDQIPEECLFPVDFVFGSMKSLKYKLGLWIDLTYTSRFYNKEDVERHECKYVKLQCRGFGQTPSPEQTQTFIKICHNFITQHPREKIGVHCTHGFNRSGFMLVSLLVEKYDWELKAALRKFSEARPPGIYKKDYLVELYKRYDDDDDDDKFVPEPPPLPDWCFDEDEEEDDKFNVPNDESENANDSYDDDDDNDDDDDDDDDNDDDNKQLRSNTNDKSGHKGRKRKKGKHNKAKHRNKRQKTEFKVTPRFMNGIQDVVPVEDGLVERIQKRVQDLCRWKRSEFPGSQPVSMTMSNIVLLSLKPYAVSWKADGVRYLMYIQDRNEIFFIDRDNCVFRAKNVTFPCSHDLNQHLTSTLLDGEMVLDKVNGQTIPRYLVYDIVYLNDHPIGEQPFFPVRFTAIKKDIVEPRQRAMQSGLINRANEPFSIRAKDFLNVQFSAKFLSDKFCETLSHEPDGLIFQPATEPYTPGQYDSLLKWKPPSLNSVDFRLKITTENGIGLLPKKVGELYVGGLASRYSVLGSVKNLQDYHNKIIECKFENNSWVFMRERTDKSFPNSYQTAESIVESIRNPITQGHLLQYIETSRYRDTMPPPIAPPPSSHASRHSRDHLPYH